MKKIEVTEEMYNKLFEIDCNLSSINGCPWPFEKTMEVIVYTYLHKMSENRKMKKNIENL